MSDFQQIIEQAFEDRAEITPANVRPEVRDAVLEAIELLDSGAERVAEPVASGWQVNEWLKKAVLLSFRIRENQIMPGGFTQYFDKVDSKFDGLSLEQHAASGELVDLGRLDVVGTVAADPVLPEIVHHDENDVRPLDRRQCAGKEQREEDETEKRAAESR